jgi:GntR family transcriptional regulator
MLPSVRGLVEAYDVNPLTAAKAYRELQREGLIETLRGEGLIVRNDVHAGLMKRERARFMKKEWPHLRARLARMELGLKTLFAAALD